MGRCQDQLVKLAGGGGDHHDKLWDPRHLGGDGIHKHRGGIGRLATRDIEPDPVQGRDLLAQESAIVLDITPASDGLVIGIGADTLGGQAQGDLLVGRDGLPGLFQARLGNLQIRCGCGLPTIETTGIVQQGRVATLAQVQDDSIHGPTDLGIRDGLPSEQRLEPFGKILVGGGESKYVGHDPNL